MSNVRPYEAFGGALHFAVVSPKHQIRSDKTSRPYEQAKMRAALPMRFTTVRITTTSMIQDIWRLVALNVWSPAFGTVKRGNVGGSCDGVGRAAKVFRIL